MKRLLPLCGLAAITVLAQVSTASATPIGPLFPPPGGVSLSTTGVSLSDSPGQTSFYDFSGSNTSLWSMLFFGITGGTVSASTGNATSFNPAYGGSGGGFGWSSQSLGSNRESILLSTNLTVFNPDLNEEVSTKVQLELQFFEADGVTPIVAGPNLGFNPGASTGMPAFVLDFTPDELADWGNGFQVKQIYKAVDPQTGATTDLADWFNAQETGGTLDTTTTAAFWAESTQTAVPEPGTLILVGSGIAAAIRRRRKHARS